MLTTPVMLRVARHHFVSGLLTAARRINLLVGLLVETNECGFGEGDVRAICDLGASAKVRDGIAAATGRKGLGFKSVFIVCDTPHLRSNGFSWRFDVRGGLYGALVPVWVEPKQMVAEMPADATANTGTSMWLPLRGDTPPQLRMSPSTLVFLRRLRAIELDRPVTMGGRWCFAISARGVMPPLILRLLPAEMVHPNSSVW